MVLFSQKNKGIYLFLFSNRIYSINAFDLQQKKIVRSADHVSWTTDRAKIIWIELSLNFTFGNDECSHCAD